MYDDIVVSAESFPTDESYHGYAEFRISVTNNSATQAHKITLFTPFRSYGHGDHIRRITRSIVLSPSSSSNVSILQQPLSMNGEGMGVIIDGKTQRKFVRLNSSSHCQSSLSMIRHGSSISHPLCVLLSRSVNLDDFQNGVDKAFPDPSSSSKHSYPGSKMWNFIKSESPIGSWSNNWLAYSRYDGIVLTASDMQAMPAPIRSTLLQYVQCGGSLLVLGKWDKPEEWKSQESVLGPLHFNYIHFGICVVSEISDVTVWKNEIWEKLKSDVWSPTASELQKKATISDANKKFPVVLNLAIPVRGLFVLVLIFAVVIGPLNLFILSRKKRRIWMLWTVPLVSIVACLAVFSYAFLAEGWKGYIRTQSITMLDENTHSATTIGVNAFYCPLTPRSGLHFDYETEVTPMGLEGWRGGRARTIDWTDDQHLSVGWVAARVPAHFLLRKSQMRRERLKITKTQDNKITALNGLGVDIRQLWYADENGRIHTAENITAGSRIALTPSGSSIPSEVRDDIWRKAYSSSWARNPDQITKDPRQYLRANCYIVVLDDSVFIEQAIENLKSKRFRSLVFGISRGPVDAG
jgi:hypothetical protein